MNKTDARLKELEAEIEKLKKQIEILFGWLDSRANLETKETVGE